MPHLSTPSWSSGCLTVLTHVGLKIYYKICSLRAGIEVVLGQGPYLLNISPSTRKSSSLHGKRIVQNWSHPTPGDLNVLYYTSLFCRALGFYWLSLLSDTSYACASVIF